MSSFPQTQERLYEMAASQPFSGGIHRGDELATGRHGLVIGEAIFDPLIDRVGDIRPESIRARISGVPHVPVILPREPLDVYMVVDTEAGQEDFWKIAELKQKLGLDLADSVWEAMPSSNDWFHLYYTGQNASRRLQHEADPIDMRSVPQLCARGLALVISDFRNFDLSGSLGNSVGIKVNHPAELHIPNGVGTLRLGGGEEVNTNKSGQVLAKNAELGAAHQSTLAQMERAGMVAASVEVSPHKSAGFEPRAADFAIARAIATVQRRSNR